MRLYLVRHGRAEDRDLWDPAIDHQRPLTMDGVKRLEVSITAFKALGAVPDVLLTSPMVRASQTADVLSSGLGVSVVEDERLAYFGVGALAEMLQEYRTAGSIMLVGHEPDFSTVVEMVTGGGHVIVKKGSLIRVDLYALRPPRGQLIWNIPPKLLVRG